MNKQLIEKYNKETQEDILETLKAYSEVSVTLYSDGKADVNTSSCISAYYTERQLSATHKTIKAEEIYTPEERNANYKESFGYDRFPLFK